MKKTSATENEICAYCEKAVRIKETEVCVCKLKGVVGSGDRCRRFRLDPLKLDPRPRVLPESGETLFFDI